MNEQQKTNYKQINNKMTTVVLKIPKNKVPIFRSFLKKHHMKIHIIEKKEDEDIMAKWIDEGMKSEEVPEEVVFETLRKNGITI